LLFSRRAVIIIFLFYTVFRPVFQGKNIKEEVETMSDMDVINKINEEFREILTRMDTPETPAKNILEKANKDFHERGCVVNVG
jgi:hypothetical protein